jgi:eukaryotic-like serine/threonine-protein kinase
MPTNLNRYAVLFIFFVLNLLHPEGRATGVIAWDPVRTNIQGIAGGEAGKVRDITPILVQSVYFNYIPVVTSPLRFTEMVEIPAGKFLMGCDSSNDECNSKQLPLHRVMLSAYKIDQYEVTNSQYQACVRGGACTPPKSNASFTRPAYYGNPDFADYPVVNVDWFQSAAFCNWLDKRLPTEAEWEKAARGDADTRIFPWGNGSPDCARLNYYSLDGFCVGDTLPVGAYPEGASLYGVMDMSGNVWEWVADRFGETYYESFPFKGWPVNPQGPAEGDERVIRGGAWDLDLRGVRVSRRQWGIPSGFDTSTGFRCAASQ